MRNASREQLIRKVGGYTLLVAGGLVILCALPLWFWLAVLGAASVAVGWFIVGIDR